MPKHITDLYRYRKAGVSKSTSKPRRSQRNAVVMRNPLALEGLSDDSPTLNDMPLDILLRITSYLGFRDMFSMDRVSLRMHAVIQMAFKQVKAICNRIEYCCRSNFVTDYHCTDDLCDPIAKLVIQRCDIQYLAAGRSIGYYSITSEILNHSRNMPNLRCIVLDQIPITGHCIDLLATHCRLLTHVTFSNCMSKSPEASFSDLFTQCTQLTYVDLSYNPWFKGSSLCFLPPTVRHLNLRMNIGISAIWMKVIPEKCPNLKSFIFDNSMIDCGDVNLIIRGLPRVKYLGIYNYAFTQSESFIDFSHNSDLEVLCVGDNPYITAESFQTLEKCKNFRALILILLYSSQSKALRYLTGCESLKVLYLSGDFDLADVACVVNSCGIQFVRFTYDEYWTTQNVDDFIDRTPTLKRLHSMIKIPSEFNFLDFVEEYFDDQLECILESGNVVNQNRSFFHTAFGESGTGFCIRQSAIEKSTCQSPHKFCKHFENILEFGTLS